MSAASNIFVDNSVETMSSHLPTSERLFPPPTSETKYRETVVLWIIEEETIPKHDDSSLIYDNIKSTVIKEGIIGEVSFVGYILNPKEDLSQEYDEYCRETSNIPDIIPGCEGDEGTRFNMMLIYIISLAFRKSGANFLVLSSNKNFGQDTRFPRVCEALEKRGINVAVAHPDTFKNVINQSGSSQKKEYPIFCCLTSD